MEMKHTPGPWKYEGGYDPLPHDYCCSTERISAGGVTIAEVATCEDDTCPGVREGWMNARLIAAAPELLDALEKAERVIRWAAQESDGKVQREIVGGWRHHAAQLRALIDSIKAVA